jgi:hypothetical protein
VLKTWVLESGCAARAGRDGQRTLPDEPATQACDWIVWLALPCGPCGGRFT